MASATDETPLLGSLVNLGRVSESPVTPGPSQIRFVWSHKIHAHFNKWAVLYLCGITIFLVDFGSFMGEGARLRMMELGICREYYSTTNPQVIGGDGDVPEEFCKLDEIQSELARMRGFLGLLENLPGMSHVIDNPQYLNQIITRLSH